MRLQACRAEEQINSSETAGMKRVLSLRCTLLRASEHRAGDYKAYREQRPDVALGGPEKMGAVCLNLTAWTVFPPKMAFALHEPPIWPNDDSRIIAGNKAAHFPCGHFSRLSQRKFLPEENLIVAIPLEGIKVIDFTGVQAGPA
jgi:hypothetical protein